MSTPAPLFDPQKAAGHVAILRRSGKSDGQIVDSLVALGASKSKANMFVEDFNAARKHDKSTNWSRVFIYVLAWAFLAGLLYYMSSKLGYGTEMWATPLLGLGLIYSIVRLVKIKEADH